MALDEEFMKRVGRERDEALEHRRRQRLALGERLLDPGIAAVALHDLAQRLVAQLGAGIADQPRHRGDVVGLDQSVGHIGMNHRAPGDGKLLAGIAHTDDLDEIFVGQHGGMLEDGKGDGVDVAGQRQRDVVRQIVRIRRCARRGRGVPARRHRGSRPGRCPRQGCAPPA